MTKRIHNSSLLIAQKKGNTIILLPLFGAAILQFDLKPSVRLSALRCTPVLKTKSQQ